MFYTKVDENIKTNFIFKNFFSENQSIYDIMWKKQNALFHFYYNNSHLNEPQDYVLCTLPSLSAMTTTLGNRLDD